MHFPQNRAESRCGPNTEHQRALIIGGLAESLTNFRLPLLHALRERGFEVHTCAADNDPRVAAKLQRLNIEHHPIPLRRSAIAPLSDIKTSIALITLIRKVKPNIILAYTIKPVIYGILAGALCGVERRYALITGLGYSFTDLPESYSIRRHCARSFATFLYRQSLKYASHIFFQNRDDQSFFIKRRIVIAPYKTSVVNGSGVDLQHFSVRPLPNAPTFLLIARLLADKGIREYVAAAKIVKEQLPHTRFLLAGPMDPNPSAISKEEVAAWQAEGTIEYLGSLEDVRPAIEEASVYVLPSYREGTPRTVLEAMAMGRPIITTDAPGCKETVVNEYNGLLVSPRNITTLASAMKSLALDPALRIKYGSNSRKLAEQKYDTALVNEAMLSAMGI